MVHTWGVGRIHILFRDLVMKFFYARSGSSLHDFYMIKKRSRLLGLSLGSLLLGFSVCWEQVIFSNSSFLPPAYYMLAWLLTLLISATLFPKFLGFFLVSILNNLMFNKEKLKMCKFPLTSCLQIICKNFFAKLVQSVSLCNRLSKKLKVRKIWRLKVGQNKDLVCYRKKQSFRQCAWGLRQLE